MISAPNANILKVGNTVVPANTTSFEMYEPSHTMYKTAPAHQKLSSSSPTFTLSTGTQNTVDITLSDTTPGEDDPAGESGRAVSMESTVYVVQPQLTVTGATTLFTSTNDGVEYGSDRDILLNATDNGTGSYFTFSVDDAPVYYSVEGSGRVYVKVNGRQTSSSSSLRTSSEAPVYLDTNNGTSKVTAYIAGNAGKTAIFIFQGPTPDKYPRLEITQGNNQTGASGGRLENYLEVKVTDGNRRPISGVAIEFQTSATNAMFIPVPGTMVYVAADNALAASVGDPVNADVYQATSTVPVKKGSPVFVQTDRSGLAKVHYELGSNNVQTITADLEGSPVTVSETFTARLGIAGSARVANLEIVSGNPQSTTKGKLLDAPLVVVARSTADFRIPRVVIQFRTNTGTLSRHGLTAKPAEGNEAGQVPTGTLNPDSGQQIYVVTGSDGQASVNYNIGQLTVAREVVAEVRHESLDSDYSFAINRVVFNINGGGSSAPSGQHAATPTADTASVDQQSDRHRREPNVYGYRNRRAG